jgi:hypothetical protein
MADDETKPAAKSDPPLSDALLDFEIDKTYESFTEAGKTLNAAFLAYFLLIGFTLLLVFGSGFEEMVEMPMLGFKVSKPYAAGLSLLLSCFMLYWLYSTVLIHNLLTYKLFDLIEKRFKVRPASNWNIGYPSFFWTSLMFLAAMKSRAVLRFIAVICFGFFVSNHALALLLAWRLSDSLKFTALQRWLWVGTCVLLLSPTLFMQVRFVLSFDEGNRRKAINKLDDPETSSDKETNAH